MNIAASSYGDNIIAAIGIVNRVVGMTTFAISGFSKGLQTLLKYQAQFILKLKVPLNEKSTSCYIARGAKYCNFYLLLCRILQ